MTSEQKVRQKYPAAEILHKRLLGATVYVVAVAPYNPLGLGFGMTKSQAWVRAAKNVALGLPPERFK